MVIIPLFSLDNEEKVIEYLKEYKKITRVIFTDYNERLSDFAIKFRKIKEMFPNIIYGYEPFAVREEFMFDWIAIDLPDFIYSSELCIEENKDKIYKNNVSKEFKGKYYGNFSLKTGYEAKDIFKQEKIARKIMDILVTDVIFNGGTLDIEKLENIKKIGKKDIYCSIRDYEIDKFIEIKEYFDGFIIGFIYNRNIDTKKILDMFF